MADIVPSLDPIRARVINALCLCDLPWSFTTGGHDCRLACGDNMEDAPFSSAWSVPVQVGDGLWRLELGSLAPLRLLPELEGAWPEEGNASTLASLPEGLRLAIMASLLGPVLDKLAQWLLSTVQVVEAPLEPLSGGNWLAVQWEFELPDLVSVPVRLYWPDVAAARHVAGRLESLPRRRVLPGNIPVVCSVEVGDIRLPIQDLRGLEAGDVLLVNSWHPEQPYVRLPDGTSFVCRAADGSAVIVGVLAVNENNTDEPQNAAGQEKSMTQETDGGNMAEAPLTEAAEPLHVDVDKLEVVVRFELESMNLSVGDLAALSTGYTFALAGDPASPVTLRVGGVAVAQGRMVDLNGVPGVQVMRMLTGVENPS